LPAIQTVHTTYLTAPRRLAARASSRLLSLALNPVLLRDVRSMFRGRRAFLLLLGYLIALAIAMAIAALIYYQEHFSYTRTAVALSGYGQYMFIGIFETQLVLLALIVIAYSASAISLEREKQTYSMLAITSLSSAEIVFGKIASITLLCLVLLLTSAPLAALCLVFGGTSPAIIGLSYGMLALKIPLWAAIGIVISISAGRTITAYAVTLVAIVAETVASVLLMGPHLDGPMCLLTPAFAPLFDDPSVSLEFLGRQLSPWVIALPYHLLLTGLVLVSAAESMLHYRPKRSAWLRALLLLTTSFFAFLLMSSALTGALIYLPHIPDRSLMLALILTWLWTCVLLPVFISYPPPPGPRAQLALLLSPRHWFRRHPTSGLGFCFCLWVAALLGVFATLFVAELAAPGFATSVLSYARRGPLLIALAIYALSILAYASLGIVLAVIHRARREVALATYLIILAVNAVGTIYLAGHDVMRRPPTNPALVLASPAAAASTVLTSGRRGSIFRRFSPDQALTYGLGYSVLVLTGAFWHSQRGRRSLDSVETPPRAGAPEAPEEV